MNGNNLGALLIRLEKRIIALEEALKIKPDKANLIHPKSEKQAIQRVAIAEELAVSILVSKEPVK